MTSVIVAGMRFTFSAVIPAEQASGLPEAREPGPSIPEAGVCVAR
jgi:hypothetical protein